MSEFRRILAMPDGPEREAAIQRLSEGQASAKSSYQGTVAEMERSGKAERMAARGIPAREIDALLSGALRDSAARTAMASHRDKCLVVLSGRIGCGKTVAAAEWMCQPRKRGYSHPTQPLFVNAHKLHQVSRFSIEAIRPLERAESLVVDDLGTEYVDEKGSFLSFLESIIVERFGNRLPTVITTNIPAAEFKARYGERIADRIRQDGAFVSLAGEHFRGAK